MLSRFPVAVIEDVQGKVTGAEFMDYVVPGQVIKLGAGGKIVIGYMKSCWREVISGIGTVIVGTDQSAVHLSQFTADIELLQWWAESMTVPTVAIGGITVENAKPLVDAGADFIAVSSGVWNYAQGPAAAVKAFNALF